MQSKDKLLIVTNLYPLPWQPTRATFNFQQFGYLEEHCQVSYLIPVAFADWWANRKQLPADQSKIRYVPYFYLPKFGRRFYGKLMQWSLSLFAGHWIRSTRANKVLGSWAYPDGVASQAIASKLNAEFYLKVHGSDINMHAQYPERANQITRIANASQGVLSVSQDLAEKMIKLGIDENKIRTIYNGVNLKKFTASEADTTEPYIVFVGNLKKEKGVLELLEGFSQIASKYAEISLRYVGSGPMLPVLKDKVKKLGLKDRVVFEGVKAHDELPEIIAKATILSLPSYNEGVPNVVLESMACSTPVVATAVGGIPEVVTEETGIIVPEISAKSVAKGLSAALDKEWDGTRIRQHAESFSWAKNTSLTLNLLKIKEK